MNVTSVVEAAPEVSAPIRLEGQPNSEVLFNWLVVKGHLWMLEDAGYLERFEELVGTWAGIRVLWRLNKWKSLNDTSHPTLQSPADKADIESAFMKLDKLLQAHFFGVEEKPRLTTLIDNQPR